MNGVYLVWRFSFVIANFFIKGDFVIGGIECNKGVIVHRWLYLYEFIKGPDVGIGVT